MERLIAGVGARRYALWSAVAVSHRFRMQQR